MLTRYWSLSQQGHFQPHSKSKAWQLSTTVKWPIVEDERKLTFVDGEQRVET